jgi:diguanylate cyclase (GGDEF)-like protein/PAS domain S-box-containing protein
MLPRALIMNSPDIAWRRTHFSLAALFEALPVAAVFVDPEGRIAAANQAAADIEGKSIDDVLGQRISDIHAEAGRHVLRNLWLTEVGLPVPDHELVIHDVTYQVSVRAVRNEAGGLIGLLATLTDITLQKRTERRLSEANRRLKAYAWEDHLTGVPSRRYLDAALTREVRRSARDGRPLSVAMLDIDHFKSFNDLYGHPAGDVCLRQVAQAAAVAVRRGADEVCRYGGEEFLAILPDTAGAAAAHVAELIRAAVEALAIPHQGEPSGHLTISLGVASLRPTGQGSRRDRDSLIAQADEALYAAKSAGRNRVAVYQPSTSEAGATRA